MKKCHLFALKLELGLDGFEGFFCLVIWRKLLEGNVCEKGF